MSSYSLWGAVFPLCVHPAAHNQASICDNPEPGVDPGRGLAVRADAGAHVGAGGGAVRANLCGEQPRAHKDPRIHSHIQSHMMEAHGEGTRQKHADVKQAAGFPSPPPASPRRTPQPPRRPPSLIALSPALQQSSCSKLIEFSAWEGPGEVRGVGAGRKLVNRSGPPRPAPAPTSPLPQPLPSALAGNNGQTGHSPHPGQSLACALVPPASHDPQKLAWLSGPWCLPLQGEPGLGWGGGI